MFKDRRLGKFYIDRKLINEQPETAKSVLDRVLVIEANIDVVQDSVEYVATCPRFLKIDAGERAPVYDWEIEDDALVFSRRDYK